MAQEPNDQNNEERNVKKQISIEDLKNSVKDRRKWMITWFKEQDTDKDGYLNKEQCLKVIERFGFSDHKDALFALFDDNADGKVSLDDFVVAMDNILKMKESKIAWISNIFSIFQLYDYDHDGHLGKKDWDIAFAQQDFTEKDSDKWWKQAAKNDKNGDGTLTFADFMRYTESLMTKDDKK